MTKGKNKSFAKRKLRRATKNVNIDVGSHHSRKMIMVHYKGIAGTSHFKPKPNQEIN